MTTTHPDAPIPYALPEVDRLARELWEAGLVDYPHIRWDALTAREKSGWIALAARELEPVTDGWMQTYTGRRFFPLAPRVDDIEPTDIAHALSLICRYGGHTHRFYSVAEHAVLMSYAVAPEHALWALLHDAAEAYVGDMVRPLKGQLPAYRRAEDQLLAAIARRFGLTRYATAGGIPPAVKEADNRILLDERAALLGPPPAPWAVEDLEPLGVTVEGWAPELAERTFAARLRGLTA